MSYLLGLITGLIFNHFWNNFRNARVKESFDKEWEKKRKVISDLSSESWID